MRIKSYYQIPFLTLKSTKLKGIFKARSFLLICILASFGFCPVLSYTSAYAAEAKNSGISVEISDAMAVAIETESVELTLHPNIHGSFGYTSSSIRLNSNAAGYKLYISSATVDTSLNLQDDEPGAAGSIAALSSDVTISSNDGSNFPTNSWGYSLDGTAFKGITTSPNLVSKFRTVDDGAMGEQTVELYFGAKADLALPTGTYKSTVVYTVIPQISAQIATIYDIDEMQQMTSTICSNTPTPVTGATESAASLAALSGHIDEDTGKADLVPEITLTDTRDGREYLIRKLADGNCWMAQNLELNLSTATALTSDDSDISTSRGSWTPNNSTQTTSSTAWAQADNNARSYSPQNETNQCINAANSATADCSTLTATQQHTNRIGNYYNWNYGTATPVKSLC